MLVIEKLARALVESRSKQLGLPLIVDVWPRLPPIVRVNAIKDAMAVLRVMAVADMNLDEGLDAWLQRAVSEGEEHLKELGA